MVKRIWNTGYGDFEKKPVGVELNHSNVKFIV